jgi:MoaA/NifB/PqqE/SkfB family radical SAM enzyme
MPFERNPFLHYEAARVYNPLTDRALAPGDGLYERFEAFVGDETVDDALVAGGWIVARGTDLSSRFRLKIVSLETMTMCNQRCYFCPVSIEPREDVTMSDEMFARIVNELTMYRDTIEGVFIQSYNEPTMDRRFVDICRTLFDAGLPVAVLTNGSGLTPAKVDALMKAGTLRYLCVNVSTLDREQYKRDRGEDHIEIVLRNLEYLRHRQVAQQMRIIVLGQSDETHERDFQAMRERFGESLFEIEKFHTIDRAGWLEVGMHVVKPHEKLAGCELMGSRPLQHLHITPAGKCVICCHDYDEKYVVGDLSANSVTEVLEGPGMAEIRKWTYGIEEAPPDFICRTCTFALTR